MMLDAPCAIPRSADDGNVQQGFVLHLGELAVVSCVQRPAFGDFHCGARTYLRDSES